MGRAVILRALSIRQPWAFAITHLGKDYENRTRRLHYRGPLLIHAGKALVRADYEAACDEIEELAGTRPPAQPELGGIVGAALLVGCEEPPSEDVGWHQAGAFGLHLERATALPFRPYRGALGVFKVILNRRELGLLREDGLIAQGSRARIR